MSPSVRATKRWRQSRDDENGFQFYSLKNKIHFGGDAGFLICSLDLNVQPVWRSIQLPAHPSYIQLCFLNVFIQLKFSTLLLSDKSGG